MLELVKHITGTLLEMYPFAEKWDNRLEEIIGYSNLSQGARDFIKYENSKTESGRTGYIGKASFLMNGGNKKDPAADKIWMDSSEHFFALRVVDDFFDDFEKDCSFEEKQKRLQWEEIFSGTRKNTYKSSYEEASVFMLEHVINKFGLVRDYLSIANNLYRLVNDVEKAVDLEEKKKIDLEICALTVEPVTRLMIPYGYIPSSNVIYAINQLSRGTRIWDHLGDLDKDCMTGAYNFILEEAKSNSSNPVSYIKNNLGRKYIAEAKLELDKGENVLEEKSKPIYKTLRTLMTAKYGIEYFMNLTGIKYRKILHKILRSV